MVVANTSPGESLLDGPRGRRLCWTAVNEQSFTRTGRRQLGFLELEGGADHALRLLKRELAATDLSKLSSCTDDVALLDLVADSVDAARYWQNPDELDLLLADRRIAAALAPVAEAICQAPASAWWSSSIALDDQVVFDHREDGEPPPPLTGAPTVVVEWKKQELADEVRFRDRWISGHWWSPPIWLLALDEATRWGPDRPAVQVTTRSLGHLGGVGLLLGETRTDGSTARCWPVRCRRPPKVCEIRHDADWLDLVERYPIELTWARRGNWHEATGLEGRWLLPDWSLVAEDYDGVHVGLTAYLGMSGRALRVGPGAATFIAGWNPDETYWLADVLDLAGGFTRWVATEHNPPRAWRKGADVKLP